MSSQFIYLSIIIASLGTYFCRAFGVLSSKNIKTNSPIFNWIRCVSLAVISAVITRIIIFPVGILEETTILLRIFCTIIVLVVYFSFKKNVILAVFTSSAFFILLNKFL